MVAALIAHSPTAERWGHGGGETLVQGKALQRPKQQQPNERAGMQRTGNSETELIGAVPQKSSRARQRSVGRLVEREWPGWA